MSQRLSASLAALTGAALSLPAYQATAQGMAAPDTQLSYRSSLYREDDLAADKTNGRPGERYAVDSHQFRLLQPLGERHDVTADLTYETMSGASPWFVVPDADGKPIQVMSGATIDDSRVALDVKTRRHRQGGRESLTAGFSREKDYLSLSLSGESLHDFNQAATSVSFAAGVSRDFLEPTDGGSTRFPERIAKADKTSVQVLVAVSQSLTPQATVQAGLGYSMSKGYLSDPYKLAYVEANAVPDSRPDERHQLSLSLRLRYWFAGPRAALKVDYRHYADSWEVVSDTIELGWVQNLPWQLRVTPSLRYHRQGAAEFYRNYFLAPRADGHYSSDYRLSSYGALAWRLGVQREWGRWQLSAAAERYLSGTHLSPHDTGAANPGLVDFSLFSLALHATFGGAVPAALRPEAAPGPAAMQVVPLEDHAP